MNSHYFFNRPSAPSGGPDQLLQSVGRLPYLGNTGLKIPGVARHLRLKRLKYVLCLTLLTLSQHFGSPRQVNGEPIEKDNGGLPPNREVRICRFAGLHWWFSMNREKKNGTNATNASSCLNLAWIKSFALFDGPCLVPSLSVS